MRFICGAGITKKLYSSVGRWWMSLPQR